MTQQFKIGDKVRVVDANGELAKGSTYTVSGFYYPHNKELLTLEGKTSGFYDWRFELVEPEKVEVGDTVEVTTPAGTTVRGEVTGLGSLGGLFFDGGNACVSAEVARSVKITKKVVKPKVWVVGDVISQDDYASETIKDGTLAGRVGDSVVKHRDKWTDVENGDRIEPSELATPRTIVYIPEVSA